MNLTNEAIAVVGDQIFTDVIGANRAKMFPILVKPINEKDIWITKFKRPIENKIIQRYLKIDWEQLINKALTRSDYLIIPTLKTTIDNTDYTIIGTLDTRPEIPENILE